MTGQDKYTWDAQIPTHNLEPGLHSIHTRFMDSNGLWSSVVSDFFHKQSLVLLLHISPLLHDSQIFFCTINGRFALVRFLFNNKL